MLIPPLWETRRFSNSRSRTVLTRLMASALALLCVDDVALNKSDLWAMINNEGWYCDGGREVRACKTRWRCLVRIRFWLYSLQRKDVLGNCRSITRDCARVNDKPDDLGVREVLQDLISEPWMARDVHNSYRLLRRNRNNGWIYLHGCLCWYILVVRKLNKYVRILKVRYKSRDPLAWVCSFCQHPMGRQEEIHSLETWTFSG